MSIQPPGQSLGFLVSDLARLMRRDFDQRVAGMGLTQAQWRTLAHLGRNEGCRQADLAAVLEIAPITLARLVDRLEESGLAERRRHPTDRRAVQLYCTRAGKRLIARMRAIASETYERALGGVASGDRERLTRILVCMRDNLAEPAVAPGPTRAGNKNGR
jgi:DNA-binding MarR family transcriptional regulator